MSSAFAAFRLKPFPSRPFSLLMPYLVWSKTTTAALEDGLITIGACGFIGADPGRAE